MTSKTAGFDCRGCGACCHGRAGTVLLLEADFTRWSAAGRGELVDSRVPGHFGQDGLPVDADGDCVHLGVDLRCRIYAIRPDTCREFAIGCAQCLEARRLAAARATRGPLTTLLEPRAAAPARRRGAR